MPQDEADAGVPGRGTSRLRNGPGRGLSMARLSTSRSSCSPTCSRRTRSDHLVDAGSGLFLLPSGLVDEQDD
jgi:hypothetical protein